MQDPKLVKPFELELVRRDGTVLGGEWGTLKFETDGIGGALMELSWGDSTRQRRAYHLTQEDLEALRGWLTPARSKPAPKRNNKTIKESA